ncbi:MAG: coproporphyrinogen oxidase [Chloroflexi bacterium]|nr:coproporphyrinogen oxidase [Chloroflexota bacterium]
MISNIARYVTHREGEKFLKLDDQIDDSRISSRILRPGEELSLYIHIPFCRRLCPFCCFNRYLFHEEKARQYYLSLRQELDLYARRGFSFSNFYFGGGTPTILMDELLSFIDYLKKKFPVQQISLETTPHEITPETVAALKAAGIKRLSLGVQSFDDEMLKAMGRTQCTGQEIEQKVLLAQGQFETLNIDLIFNFPFQTVEKFAADIATFKKLGIDQVTFYPLMPSPHKKEVLESRFAKVDNSREKQYYDVILKEIYLQGYQASTVWCFSRGPRMIDEYIIDYADYIGIGSGSVSLVNGIFYVNTFALDRYAGLLQNDHLPVVRWRFLSEQEYLRYYLLTKIFGLRVDKDQFRQQFGADIHKKLGIELSLLKIAGAISEDNHSIRVNPQGMRIVSLMMREFFASLNTLRELCLERQV